MSGPSKGGDSYPADKGNKGLPPNMPKGGKPSKGKNSSSEDWSGYRQMTEPKKHGLGKPLPPDLDDTD